MTKNKLKEHYERKYAHKSAVSPIKIIKKVQIPRSRFEAVVKFFPNYFKGGDVLEIGAGNGNVAKTLLNTEMKISSYTLGDICLPRIEGLRKNLKDNRVLIVEMDAEDLSNINLNKYDAVIMIDLIEHLIDPLLAMQRIRQLLKPGGFVYINTPNFAKYTQRVKLLFGRFPSTASKNEGLTLDSNKPADLYDEGHLHYFTYRSLTLLLTKRCGFSKIIKLGYPGGKIIFGKHVHNYLAKIWPEMFSQLVVIAYA